MSAALVRNISHDSYAVVLWRITSLGAWSLGSNLIFLFGLILYMKDRMTTRQQFLIMLPGTLFFVLFLMDFVLGWTRGQPLLPARIGALTGNIFYLLFLSLASVVLIRWGREAAQPQDKALSRWIVASLILTTLCLFFYDTLGGLWYQGVRPHLLPVFPLFWIVAMGVSVSRYGIQELNPGLALPHVMENVQEIIILTDPQDRIQAINNRGLSLIGLNREEVLKKPLSSVFPLHQEASREEYPGKPGDTYLVTVQGTRLPLRILTTLIQGRRNRPRGKVIAAQNLTMERRYQKLSATDQLTQIANRLKLDEILDYEAARADRGNPFSVILMDIDFFKRINDEYGHQRGDQVLIHLTALLQKHIRSADTLGRWGGEEFLILLPDTEEPQAFDLAEKLCRLVEEAPHIPVTLSLGVASFHQASAEAPHPDSPSQLISRADKALYQAKAEGRNRVCRFRE